MKKRLLSLSVLILLLISPVHDFVNAEIIDPQSIDDLSSAVAPAGYSPRYVQEDINQRSGADILLIQTALPWDSDADMVVLNSLGYSYDIVDMYNIDSVNLFNYPVILIVNDQVQEFYDAYASRVSEFENYVSAGGVLVFFAASDGWAMGTLNAPLPGGVEVITPYYEYYNYIAAPNHPIATAILSDNVPLEDSDLYNTYCSHGYFTSLVPNTTIIFDVTNLPTMIEYPLGNGKVIASTNTWEHSFTYDDNYFGDKALDDVFLYAFSEGGSYIGDLSIDLRIDDAPDTIIVNKSNGSYVDIVAKVQGGQAYEPNITLEVPLDLFGTPVKTFTRNFSNNNGYGEENEYTNLGDGKYSITTTLSPLPFPIKFYKEIVWRFQVPQSLSPQSIQLIAIGTWEDESVYLSSIDKVMMRIIDWGNTIAVTNRDRLFDESDLIYGDDASDLLEETYKVITQKNGEVFYVDYYGIDWDENETDELIANQIVNEIDNLIEEWYGKMTKSYLKPQYMVIIGGDEIIPFYRMDDDEYNTCWWTTCEDGTPWIKTGDYGSIGNLYRDNYFLSDNIYADIGGGIESWENGDLELSIGRIVGENSTKMREFINNAQNKTKPLSEAAVASDRGLDVNRILSELNKKNVLIHSESDPDLIENSNWTESEFLYAWQSNSQLYSYNSHGSPFAMYAPGTGRIEVTDLIPGKISSNHPLAIMMACNLVVPLESGMLYKYIDQGFAGILGSTGIASALNYDFYGFGEQLVNSYVNNLISDTNISNNFGKALLQTKQDYNPKSKTGRKTVLEFTYYGLPWSIMETPNNNVEAIGDELSGSGFSIINSIPTGLSRNTVSTNINITVNNYSFTDIDSYNILNIDGTQLLSGEESLPGLPYVNYTLYLPTGSSINSLVIFNENPINLGVNNLPMVFPINPGEEGNGLEPFTGTGVYPTNRLSYQVVDFPDYTAVEITLVLAEFDGSTDILTLFDSTEIQVDYTTSQPAFISAFELDKPEFQGNESINGNATVENVSAADVTLTGVLEIFENAASQGTISIPAFVVTAGSSYDLPVVWSSALPHGTYTAVLYLYNEGVLISGMQDDFRVLSGRISNFSAPENALPGQYNDVSLSFENYLDTPVNVIAEIMIYAEGIEISKLLQQELPVGAHSEGTINWFWNPSGLGDGVYTLKPVVSVLSDYYHTSQREVEIDLNTIYLPLVMHNWNPNSFYYTPNLTGPAEGEVVNTLIPTLSWEVYTLLDPGTWVYYWISSDPNFSYIDYSGWGWADMGITQISWNLEENTTYYWYAAYDYYVENVGWRIGPTTEVRSFTTGSGGTILPAPTLISPANGTTGISTFPLTLDWDPVAGALEYEVQLWFEYDPPYWGYYRNYTTDTQLEYSNFYFDSNTYYEWRVIPRNDYAWGTPSAKWSFTTGTVSGISAERGLPAKGSLELFTESGERILNKDEYIKNLGDGN